MYCSKYEMLLILDEIFDLLMDSNIECQSRLDEVLALVKKKSGIVRKTDFCCGPKQVMIDTSMCGVPDKTITVNDSVSAGDPAGFVKINKEILSNIFSLIQNLQDPMYVMAHKEQWNLGEQIKLLQTIVDNQKGLVE